MSRMPRWSLLWPGLPQLWHCGCWSGLILAAGFAVLLDICLVSSFIWQELLGPRDLRLGWLALGAIWSGSAILSAGSTRRPRAAANQCETLFREAVNEYLQGNWFEAESTLERLLRREPRDVEARLLLATMLRRIGRHDEAASQLNRLERLTDAEKWKREIDQERQRLGRSQPKSDEAAAETAETAEPVAHGEQGAEADESAEASRRAA